MTFFTTERSLNTKGSPKTAHFKLDAMIKASAIAAVREAEKRGEPEASKSHP